MVRPTHTLTVPHAYPMWEKGRPWRSTRIGRAGTIGTFARMQRKLRALPFRERRGMASLTVKTA